MATVTKSQLPVSHKIKIERGDTFNGPIFRHKNADGSYIDTTAWAKVGTIYEKNSCTALEIGTLTIVNLPGPEFGYQPTLTPEESIALPCGNKWYDIETDDGTTVRTYFEGIAVISGAGNE